jgi:hypothetical protein
MIFKPKSDKPYMNITNNVETPEEILFTLAVHINFYYDEIFSDERIINFFENSSTLLGKLIVENPHLTKQQLECTFLAFNLLMYISLANITNITNVTNVTT